VAAKKFPSTSTGARTTINGAEPAGIEFNQRHGEWLGELTGLMQNIKASRVATLDA
jgi:hypothetical protein